jgi:hypothetical protein
MIDKLAIVPMNDCFVERETAYSNDRVVRDEEGTEADFKIPCFETPRRDHFYMSLCSLTLYSRFPTSQPAEQPNSNASAQDETAAPNVTCRERS